MSKIYINLEDLSENLQKKILISKVKRKRVSYEVSRKGLQIRPYLKYTPVYSVDQKTKKRKYKKLSTFNKVHNIIINHNITCFRDTNWNIHLHLKQEGIIAPLFSEETLKYFRSRGVTSRLNLIDRVFSHLECVFTRILDINSEMFDPEELQKCNKEIIEKRISSKLQVAEILIQ